MTRLTRFGRPSPRRTMAAIGVVVLAVLVVAVAVGPWTGSTPSPSPRGSTQTLPSASPIDWAAIQPPEIPVVATLAPSQIDETGLRPGTTFTLASLSGEPAAQLAARLQVTPAVDLTLSATDDTARAELVPMTPLAAGQVYRFALRSPDGALTGSWAFRVRGPLRVLSTIPGDRTTNVPINTGIEVTFDQDGAASIADHFAISPAVEGRFESHGRTQAFVPNQALKASTLYTVAIRAGLPRTGSDLSLESDVVFQFETAGATTAAASLRMARDVIEYRATDVPLLAVEVDQPGRQPGSVPTTADVVVYRFPSEGAATAALDTFLKAPRWTQYADPLLPTGGLPATARFSASLESSDDSPARVIRFPETLATGWYLVEIAGQRPSQVFLQVTSVSAWVSVSVDQTIVWVNDVSTGKAIAGATAEIAGSAPFGTSAASGVIDARTPNALLPTAEAGGLEVPPTPPILVVRSPGGGAVLVPFEVPFRGDSYGGEWWDQNAPGDSVFWSLLSTDRGLYRASDSIRAWGYLRARDGGAVPSRVELRIVAQAVAGLTNPPVLVRGEAIPGPTGAFTAELKYADAPLGYYDLQAVMDGKVVSARSVEITVVRKPSYQLALTTDHRAIIAGSSIRWVATATFFDGTPVPSLPLSLSSSDGEAISRPTDATGSSDGLLTPLIDAGDLANGGREWSLAVGPAVGEEAEIGVSAIVIVFPSSDHLQASAVLTASQLRVTGTVHQVDLAKVEKARADGTWNGDPSGAPVPGRTVRAVVTEIVPVRREIGSYYDFMEKVTRPRYQYDSERKVVKTLEVVSGSAGAFAFNLTVPDPGHQYEIALSSTDPQGRVEVDRVYAGRADDLGAHAGVRFEPTSADQRDDAGYDVGDKIAWRITEDGQPASTGGQNRYLYIASQRGVVGVAVSTSSTFTRTFGAADAPGVYVIGVRFTGRTYAPKAASWAYFNPATRTIGVTISADRPRYQPGDDAKLTVQTTNDAGRPIAATVVLQAVDEKLFAIGAAGVPRPLEELYVGVDSGIVRLTSTHHVPTFSGADTSGGDTTGGGDGRTDFRDTLAFLSLTTGADGRATTTIRLSDDLTAWHVSAVALTAGLQVGVGDLLIPVGLPLFAEVTVADSYLVSDQPTIRLRAFGLALQPSDPVEFTVSAPALGLEPTVIKATAFTGVPLALPALSVGRHEVRVALVAPTRTDSTGAALRDALVRTFDVVSSRVTAVQTWYGTIGATLPAVPATAAATYTFSDAGRGRYLPVLMRAADLGGERLDNRVAQQLARDQLVGEFGFDRDSLPRDDFRTYTISSVSGGPDGSPATSGVALLPYGGPDPRLAARIAVMAPDALDPSQLRDALLAIRAATTTQRDLRIAAVAGLAALGEPVLADLADARAAPDLSVTERLYLGLGYAALGDDASARQIERALIVEYGRRLGPWIRLQAGGTPSEIADQTALLAVLAASLGDPLTPAMLEYVAANPSTETSNDLELASAAARIIERTPAAAAAFAYTVDGMRSEVALTPGNGATLVLTSAQRATLRVEAQSGTVGVAVSWRSPVNAASLAVDPNLGLQRTVPAEPVAPGQLVTVDIVATFKSVVPSGDCYLVVEEVPSGLAPLAGAWEVDRSSVTWPSRVVGQEVTFCVSNPAGAGGSRHLRYVARIVTAGTYTWEPAIMQFGQDAKSIAMTSAGTLIIRN